MKSFAPSINGNLISRLALVAWRNIV